MSEDDKIKKFFCRLCGQKTNHFVRAEHTKIESQDDLPIEWRLRMLIVECCGCENPAMVKLDSFSEDDEYSYHPVTNETVTEAVWNEAIYPPVNYRKPPKWFDGVPDAVLRSISEEIYKSLQMESHYLAAFGARTLIDRLITLVVGDKGNFKEGLDALQKDEKLSPHDIAALKPVIEAGNAAAHRGWAPTIGQINTILDTVEGLIHRLLVSPAMIEEL